VIDNTPYLKVYQISCGFRNSYFLTENRKIYYSGYCENSEEKCFPILFNSIDKVKIILNY
jgi:hypothetical protein